MFDDFSVFRALEGWLRWLEWC